MKQGFTLVRKSCKGNPLGFTLVELVVVISIVTVLGLIFTDSLVQTFKGENKVKLVSQVKDSGADIMSKLSQNIRRAEYVICVGDSLPNSDTIVMFSQGVYYRYRFYFPQTGSDPQNGYIIGDEFTSDDYPSITSERCSDPNLLSTKSSNLSNKDKVTGVSVNVSNDPGFTDTVFKKETLAGYPEAISVKFRISAGVSSPQSSDQSTIDNGYLFATTVGVRGRKQ